MQKFLKRLSVDQFNTLYPSGSKFTYYSRKTDEKGIPCTIPGGAWALGHGEAVVRVEGVSGCVAITHLVKGTEC